MKKKRRRKKRKIQWEKVLLALFLCILIFGICNQVVTWLTDKYRPHEPTIYQHDYQFDHFQEKDGFIVYEDEKYTSKIGIDVSFHQGKIAWDKLSVYPLDFAIVRLGYRGYQTGLLHTDEQFLNNVTGAKAIGLQVGVYFFSQAINVQEAIQEAEYVLQEIHDLGIDGPIVFDMEKAHEQERIRDLTMQDRTMIAQAFCKTIKDVGYQPMIYGNIGDLLSSFDMIALQDDYDFWLASYHEHPNFQYVFDMWQYREDGKLDGIEKDVDFNVWIIPRQS